MAVKHFQPNEQTNNNKKEIRATKMGSKRRNNKSLVCEQNDQSAFGEIVTNKI